MEPHPRLNAYLRLHLADGIGSILFRRLIEALGGVEQVLAAGPGQWRKVEGVGEKTTAGIAAVTDAQVAEELALASQRGVAVVCLEDEDYPKALKMIHDPPPVLYVRGRLEAGDAVAVGIVGSRHCTHYGLEQAERFAQLLARAGFTIISGGARGIDTAGHRGALAAGGRTIAVMGCGLCHAYPQENAELFDRIVAEGRGAVISELPMRTAVLGGNFPTRNRIISGLSLGVLVVEAARRSGALITAREASEQGREVFAVPGRVDSPLSQGTNELIRSGATLVQNLEDILQELGQVGAAMTADEPAEAPVLPPGLNETEQKLLAELDGQPLSVDDLVHRSGLPAGKVAGTMTMLVLKGAVVQQPGNVFARRRAKNRL